MEQSSFGCIPFLLLSFVHSTSAPNCDYVLYSVVGVVVVLLLSVLLLVSLLLLSTPHCVQLFNSILLSSNPNRLPHCVVSTAAHHKPDVLSQSSDCDRPSTPPSAATLRTSSSSSSQSPLYYNTIFHYVTLYSGKCRLCLADTFDKSFSVKCRVESNCRIEHSKTHSKAKANAKFTTTTTTPITTANTIGIIVFASVILSTSIATASVSNHGLPPYSGE